MAKKRKTRKEKQLADQRYHQHSSFSSEAKQATTESSPKSPLYSFSAPLQPSAPTQPATIKTTSYNFLQKDLLHTLLVTIIIIAAQVILFIFIK